MNIKTNHERTALHAATDEGYEDIVELLLTHGAGVNSQDVDGWTALHLATSKGISTNLQED